MAPPVTLGQPPEIEYPDSDGDPLSDNTLQLEWIFLLKSNLDLLFKDDPNVFVAGDLLWYPVQGHPEIRCAPDTLVAFGRPKGYRGSYKQWEEGGIAPQVVFEVLSPGNRPDAMAEKLRFYDIYGVEEYYLYDPDNPFLSGWRRVGQDLQLIPEAHNWVSPRLKVRFDLSGPEMVIYDARGEKFLTFLEQQAQREKAEQQARETHKRAEQERVQREKAEQQARDERLQREKAEERIKDEQKQREKAEQRARWLEEQLRAAGLDPDALPGSPGSSTGQ